MTHYYESMGRFELEIPDEAIGDCSHQGRCDEDVEYWLPKVSFAGISRQALIDSLSETGGWSRDELKTETNETLQSRILWIACGDLAEERRTEGVSGGLQ